MLPIEQIIERVQALSLTTERLNLRRFISTDLDEEVKAQQDPEVVRFIREPLSNEEAIEYFQNYTKQWEGKEGEWLGLCVVRQSDGQQIGVVSFRFEEFDFAIVEIGYRFNPGYQGKGYAVEAVTGMVDFIFSELKIHKVVAFCDPRNTPSFKLMEKLNMQKEGLLRQNFKIGQQWSDTLVYGLLESEWVSCR